MSVHVCVCVCVCVLKVFVCVLDVCHGACQPARLSWRAPAGGGGFRRAPCLHWLTGACWETGREGVKRERRRADMEREREIEKKKQRRDRGKDVETDKQP